MRLLFLATIFLVFSCTSTDEKNEDVKETTKVEKETKTEPSVTGFDSIEALSESLVESLKKKDYNSYLSHVMTSEMEEKAAEQISDPEIRKEFLHEYGFSLKEEKEYFDDFVKYVETQNLDLEKAVIADMESTEYKGGEYEPLELYEVFIPIEMEFETLIDFTVIKIDNKYYLTSELGV